MSSPRRKLWSWSEDHDANHQHHVHILHAIMFPPSANQLLAIKVRMFMKAGNTMMLLLMMTMVNHHHHHHHHHNQHQQHHQGRHHHLTHHESCCFQKPPSFSRESKSSFHVDELLPFWGEHQPGTNQSKKRSFPGTHEAASHIPRPWTKRINDTCVNRETLERNEGMKFGLAMTMKQAKANQTEAQEGPHLHGGRLPAFLPTPPAELPSGSRGWRALAEKNPCRDVRSNCGQNPAVQTQR